MLNFILQSYAPKQIFKQVYMYSLSSTIHSIVNNYLNAHYLLFCYMEISKVNKLFSFILKTLQLFII